MDHIIDAKNKRLGRLATEIALILQGKKSPHYEPRLSGGDKAILKNFRHLSLGGRKSHEKTYYRHTGYVGHLKEVKFEDAFRKDPRKVIRETVRRMLPKNSLAKKRLKNLVFEEENV